jgi:hypothetical protein
MDSDYRAVITYVNRPDLLIRSVESMSDIAENLTIIDNSVDGIDLRFPPAKYLRPTYPLFFTQAINYALLEAKKAGCAFLLRQHADAMAHSGVCLKVVEMARRLSADGWKWGVIFTVYDTLAAFNLDVLDDVGLWDTVFPAYFADNDWFWRIKLAGYQLVDSGFPMDHEVSAAIHSDPRLMFMNHQTFPLYQSYYERKWGGLPGHETFTVPFNRPDMLG